MKLGSRRSVFCFMATIAVCVLNISSAEANRAGQAVNVGTGFQKCYRTQESRWMNSWI